MTRLPNKKDSNGRGVQKKKLRADWRPNGVSRTAQQKEAARLYEIALKLTKEGKILGAQKALKKANAIKNSL